MLCNFLRFRLLLVLLVLSWYLDVSFLILFTFLEAEIQTKVLPVRIKKKKSAVSSVLGKKVEERKTPSHEVGCFRGGVFPPLFKLF